jgi:hypothetical protein
MNCYIIPAIRPGLSGTVPEMKNLSRCPGNLSNVPEFTKIHIYMYLILGLTAPRICVYMQRLHDNAYPNRQTTLRVKIDQLTGVLLSYRLSHVRGQTEKAALFNVVVN